jgi:radical SAM/Cys-rich protein
VRADIPIGAPRAPSKHDFATLLRQHGLVLAPRGVGTLQVNITRLCNQACRHCHVDASPTRTEQMSAAGLAQCLALLERHAEIATLDITGGAPELHPGFEGFVERATALGKRVMVRHNLTVQADGHPQTGRSMAHLPEFFARHGVEVVSSLPYHQGYFTDAQRGAGVFDKSVAAIRRLNAVGYGAAGSGLVLDLVYNPVGPYLPAAQATLEADFKRELGARHGLVFNRLFTITNMPINRFRLHLEKSGQYGAYMDKLLGSFNAAAAAGVMCREMISVDHEGRIHDCDFNQMLDLPATDARGRALSIFDFDIEAVRTRPIRFGDHCLGCTAGAGSSCGGATTTAGP